MQRDFKGKIQNGNECLKYALFFWKEEGEVIEYVHVSAHLTKKKHRKDKAENNDLLCVCMCVNEVEILAGIGVKVMTYFI